MADRQMPMDEAVDQALVHRTNIDPAAKSPMEEMSDAAEVRFNRSLAVALIREMTDPLIHVHTRRALDNPLRHQWR